VPLLSDAFYILYNTNYDGIIGSIESTIYDVHAVAAAMDEKTTVALGKAAKLAAIDSEIERIAAELREYGLETELGSGLFSSSEQLENDAKIFEEVLQRVETAGVLSELKRCEFKSLVVGGSQTSKALSIVKSVTSNSLRCWICKNKDGGELFIFFEPGSRSRFSVCTREALTKKDPRNYPLIPFWSARGLNEAKMKIAEGLVAEHILRPN